MCGFAGLVLTGGLLFEFAVWLLGVCVLFRRKLLNTSQALLCFTSQHHQNLGCPASCLSHHRPLTDQLVFFQPYLISQLRKISLQLNQSCMELSIYLIKTPEQSILSIWGLEKGGKKEEVFISKRKKNLHVLQHLKIRCIADKYKCTCYHLLRIYMFEPHLFPLH